jgi:NAD(P)-dependent dehydrogenase (short-subunit alcohol dehydrogenase family)
MRGLKGKNVLVTGGASGIGQATATRFLEEGCAVCVLDRDEAARTRVAEELPGLAPVCSTPTYPVWTKCSQHLPRPLTAWDRSMC